MGREMDKGRLEAFTDGVIAVIITIMVLELKPPHEPSWRALSENAHVFLSYVLSFIYVGIYWNNHHHMLHAVKHVNGKVMWANLFFLFWLSLFPFTTSWLNEAAPVPAPVPTAIYGVVLLLTALSWVPLQSISDRSQRRRQQHVGACDRRSVGRLEGNRVADHLSCRHCIGVFRAHRVLRAVRSGGGAVVHSRSSHRK